jgi:uncharacterized membrane protein
MKENILAVLGLFLPVCREKDTNKRTYAIKVGGIPLGWVMIAAALIF